MPYAVVSEHLFWFVLSLIVIVSETSVATFAPCVEAPVVKDTGRVGGATLDVHHPFPLHGVHKPRSVHITVIVKPIREREREKFEEEKTKKKTLKKL